jgi:exonuclease III
MRVAHINLRSIHTGFNDFKTLVVDNDYDVIMVTETWLKNTQDPSVCSIPGYKFYNVNRVERGVVLELI